MDLSAHVHGACAWFDQFNVCRWDKAGFCHRNGVCFSGCQRRGVFLEL